MYVDFQLNYLSRTTSLEDVFRHVTGNPFPIANQSSKADTPQGFKSRRDFVNGADYNDDYEVGTITGYAVNVVKV